MTFLKALLSGQDLAKARAINDFKSSTPMGPGFDPDLRESYEAALHTEMEPIAARLHAAVSARVTADPRSSALADQFEAELVDTARRGRRA